MQLRRSGGAIIVLMRSRLTHIKIACWILACASTFAAGQSVSTLAPAQASALNLTFYRNVLDEIEPTIDPADASQPAVVDSAHPAQKPARTTLQEAIGLTKHEAEFVRHSSRIIDRGTSCLAKR